MALICRQGQCCPFFEDTVHHLMQGRTSFQSLTRPNWCKTSRLTTSWNFCSKLICLVYNTDTTMRRLLLNLHHADSPGLSTYAVRMHMIIQCGLFRKRLRKHRATYSQHNEVHYCMRKSYAKMLMVFPTWLHMDINKRR